MPWMGDFWTGLFVGAACAWMLAVWLGSIGNRNFAELSDLALRMVLDRDRRIAGLRSEVERLRRQLAEVSPETKPTE